MSGSTGGAAAASLEKAIHVINRLAVELDIHSAVSAVRHVALELLDCQRVTLFLALNGNTLRCKLPEHEGGTIEVMFGEGIAGTVAQTGQLMNIPDAYSNNLFNNSVDLLTGFKTKQILCCAIQDYTGETIAVLQALNTRSGQCFTAQDETNLKLFGVHLGNTLSKAKLHEQVKREKERMATLSNCFKRLNAANSLPQVLAVISDAVRQLVYARHTFVYLADQARQELWLTQPEDSSAGYINSRSKLGHGLLGTCGVQHKQVRLDLTDGAPLDPLLEKLLPLLDHKRPRSVLLQPITEVRNPSRCNAVLVAVDKVTADYCSDFFYEELFTQSDCDAMNVFAIEVGDILSDRSLEVSFASALSVVAANGCSSAKSHLSCMLKAQLLDYYSMEPQADMERMASGSTCGSGPLPLTPRMRDLSPRKTDVPAVKARCVGMSYDMDTLKNWALDFTELPSEELVKMAYDIFMLSGVVSKLGICKNRLSSFITAVATHMHNENPYHNFCHVVHVLHAVFLMLETTAVRDFLSCTDILVLLVTALCHDLDHDGHTNSYHINAGSDLAQRYNDCSVMENHHCAIAFAILRHKDCNILEDLPQELRKGVRKLIIDCILATDMSQHFTITNEFTKHSLEYNLDDASDRTLLSKVLLHAADISNQARPFSVSAAMSERVQQEFTNQVHKERAAGLPVAPHMQADTPEVCAKMEVNFIDYIVLPLWTRLQEVFPELETCITNIHTNRLKYSSLAQPLMDITSPRSTSGRADTCLQQVSEEQEEQQGQQQ